MDMDNILANGDKVLRLHDLNASELIEESLTYSGHYIGPAPFKRQLGAFFGESPECFYISYGVDFCFQKILDVCKGRRILCFYPSYPFGEFYSSLSGREIIRCNLNDDGSYPVEIDGSVLDSRPEIVLIVNPTNPGGLHIEKNTLLHYMELLPDSLFVVDEAYVGACQEYSMMSEASHNPRMIVLRSLSKGFALPGARVGYAYSCDPGLIEMLQDSGHVFMNSFAFAIIRRLMTHDYLKKSLAVNLDAKRYLIERLSEIPYLEIMETDTIFVLARFLGPSIRSFQSFCDNWNIELWWFNETEFFRDYFGYPEISHPSLKNTFRISGVDKDEVDEIMARLKNYQQENP